MKKTISVVLMMALTLSMCVACGEGISDGYDDGYQKGYQDGLAISERESHRRNVIIGGEFTATVRGIIPDYCLDDATPQIAVVTLFQDGPFTIYIGEEYGKTLAVGRTYVFEIAEKNIGEVEVADIESGYLDPAVAIAQYDLQIRNIRLAKENEYGLDCNHVRYTSEK